MRNIKLFDSGEHKFVLLNESEPGEEEGIRSNQYLVVHGDNGVLLDPGGFGVMPSVLTELLRYIKTEQIKAIILSHQDPDIVGGLSTWLELTDAPVYVSSIWLRFLPHYGIASMAQFVGVPDAGKQCRFAEDFVLQLVPAHFLHSEGQINVYDPIAKVLFTGDIGAAMLPVDVEYEFVDDFAAHLPYIEGFHRRYMVSNKAARLWVDAVSVLDIEMLAPQHGPVYRGRAVADFLNWFKTLQCGVDLMTRSGHFEMESRNAS
ncbi:MULTISPECIES: oxygen-binding di-iron domain-containing protein [Methylotuvimicrobium]|uniref:Beta-lactamase domain protein n=2 Tax=Methylotuvimicrobium TaxID=2822410 RepID=G4STX4_META2|nr:MULTISPECIES: MBL fold metallo-hydrolase [Methylotuvimicrobium]QCW83612.1 MBL fold metallo-hydrolase [Methylotuvimicrobium buryatense]CCE22797.1 Beta-lactamase domain protein [Methylotuvimicrobium alcaliphilum 20Z]